MRLSQPDPNDPGLLSDEIQKFWEEVLQELRGHYGSAPSGRWDDEIRDFRITLSQLAARSSEADRPTAEVAIYHENPAEVAKAIAIGRFRESPSFPGKSSLIEVLTEARDTARA